MGYVDSLWNTVIDSNCQNKASSFFLFNFYTWSFLLNPLALGSHWDRGQPGNKSGMEKSQLARRP